MTMSLAPVMKQRFFDSNGDPLAGGLLYTYQAGTTTPQSTYTDSGGGTPNANPLVLDANGEVAVWLDPTLSYKFVLKNSGGATQWTTDNVIGMLTNNAVATASIQDSAVTAAKIADDAVTASKLADDALVDSNRAVTTSHIRDNAVTAAKMSDGDILNLGLAASVGSSALTISLKDAAASAPSASSPVKIAFRSSTATDGTKLVRSVSSALSLTVSSGSTLGTTNGNEHTLWVYAIDSDGAGTIKIGISQCKLDDASIQSTTAEGGAGGADSASVIYSDAAYSNKAIRLVGRLKSTQTTAGTWAAVPSEISVSIPGITSHETVSAELTGSYTLSGNTIIMPTKTWDSHGAYNTTTGTYAAPESGLFLVDVKINTAANNSVISVYVNGSFRRDLGVTSPSANGHGNGSGIIRVSKDDSITIQNAGAAASGSNQYISFTKIAN